jgi:CheY-like chemotaxis protein
MSKGKTSKRVLLLDDEPEYLTWVQEFLACRGLNVVFARTLAEARRAMAAGDFRLLLVDMNVPPDESVPQELTMRVPLIQKYPGLVLAIEARNQGYGAHSVIGYTVHDDEAIDTELTKLNCRYVLKGRPQALKLVIDSSLKPPPRT